MEMSGEHRLPASRERVWALLNNPDVLKQCIPGCQEIEQHGDDAFAAKVQLKIGPVKAKFAGDVELQDKVYPESYRIVGSGSGGIAGFAKGGATVNLGLDGDETILTYQVDAQVGGKIAQLGARLIRSTSAKLAGQFFEKFSDIASSDTQGGTQAA